MSDTPIMDALYGDMPPRQPKSEPPVRVQPVVRNRVSERPILFSGEMVRAILAGRKTQTRRVLKDPSEFGCLTGDCPHETQIACDVSIKNYANYDCPYGRPGDRLWVRETWFDAWAWEKATGLCTGIPDHWLYRADFNLPESKCKWRPSIFMPREASRLNLELKAVRIEHVQEITAADALKEGILRDDRQLRETPNFRQLWDSLNAKRGFGWAVNPLVWVLTFEKISNAPAHRPEATNG